MEAALIPGLCDDVAELCLLRVAYDHLSTVDSVCRRWRHLFRSTDFHTRRRLAGHSRHLFVFEVLDGGPAKRLLLFDPTSGTWRCFPGDPSVQPYLTPYQSTVVGAGRYWVSITRGDRVSPVRIYDFCTGIWRGGAPMHSPANQYVDAAWDGARRVFVASGYYNIDRPMVLVMCYYVEEDRWEAFSDCPVGSFSFFKAAFHAGVFHVIDCSVVVNDHIMHSLDVSSRSWSTVQLKTRGMGVQHNMFTIAPDGRMYYCCYGGKRGKLSVRDGQTWQELVELDLPLNVYYTRHITCWKGGVLVMGMAPDRVPLGVDRIKMYTANLKAGTDYKQSVSWTPQSLPVVMKGYAIHGLWIEI